jgi:hypothetical protein
VDDEDFMDGVDEYNDHDDDYDLWRNYDDED